MSERDLTCVVCPNGCPLVVEIDDGVEIDASAAAKDAGKPVVARVRGKACERGEAWARQEIENPMRTIASSVPVLGGDYRLASVRTSRPIPLSKVRAVMEEIRRAVLEAPVEIGDLVIASPAGCDTEVIATRAVARSTRGLSSPRS
jgi:CxxC motif-containing protein